MVWTDEHLKFVTNNRAWPQGLTEGLPVKPVPNLKHFERSDKDYERHVYRSTEESNMDYMLTVERIERPNNKDKHDVVITISHCNPGSYQRVQNVIIANAAKINLERILENRNGTGAGRSPVIA